MGSARRRNGHRVLGSSLDYAVHSLLGALNDFAFMAQLGDARRTKPESPEELMALPLAYSDPSVGRRKPDRIDASRIWASISDVMAPVSVAPISDCSGAHWARQGSARSARRWRALDPPGALPGVGNYRSDAANHPGESGRFSLKAHDLFA